MKAGILGDLRRFGLDALVGLAIFSVLAVFLLGGEAPRELPQVSSVLSIEAYAADSHLTVPRTNPLKSQPRFEAKPFRFTDVWTALSVMAVAFAMLYAFNLALFRRFAENHARNRGRRRL